MNDKPFAILRDRVSAFRETRIRPEQKIWTPPILQDFLWCKQIQAVDQSLGNCGLIRFVITEGGRVDVRTVKTLHPMADPGMVSFAASYEKAFHLREQLVGELWPVSTVMEMPSVGGYRTESSLLAGYVVWDVVRDGQGQAPVIVSKNHVGKMLCDDPKAPKPKIREAVGRYLPESVKSTNGWNEHTRDALAIGLTHLYDLKREGTDG